MAVQSSLSCEAYEGVLRHVPESFQGREKIPRSAVGLEQATSPPMSQGTDTSGVQGRNSGRAEPRSSLIGLGGGDKSQEW